MHTRTDDSDGDCRRQRLAARANDIDAANSDVARLIVDEVINDQVVDRYADASLFAQFGRERPETQPGGFWADERPKTGGRSRPNCARRETRQGLAALSI